MTQNSDKISNLLKKGAIKIGSDTWDGIVRLAQIGGPAVIPLIIVTIAMGFGIGVEHAALLLGIGLVFSYGAMVALSLTKWILASRDEIRNDKFQAQIGADLIGALRDEIQAGANSQKILKILDKIENVVNAIEKK